MAREEYDVYLEGDPNTQSTRRRMERMLTEEPRKQWPWLLGFLAGGTALAFWRIRRARRPAAETVGRIGRSVTRS